MFLLSLSRIIKFALQNFVRNIWLAIVTITIIVLALFSVTSLVFVNAVMDKAIGLVESKVDISVFFKPVASQEQIMMVKDSLQSLEFVYGIVYVSKSEALENLRQRFNDRPLILESIKELDNNPLGDTLVISTNDTKDYQRVIDTLNFTPEYKALIDNNSFDDNEFIIARLEKLSNQITRAGWGIIIFFALVAILVIINTIRIAIYTHRNEIGIMKLVGASNSFVRGPFVLETAIYVLIGVAITIALTYVVAGFADPYVNGLLGPGVFSVMGYLNSNLVLVFGLELVGMLFVAAASSALALSRYLKV